MEPNQTDNIPRITTPATPSPVDSSFLLTPQPSSPSFLQKYGTIILISGIIISTLLIILGIIFHVTYKPEGVSHRNINTIQAELAEINVQISSSSSTEQSVFEQGGFSDAFFESNNTLTELEFQRDTLQQELNAAITAQNSINVFTTGAFYFFLSAFVLFVISIILFILSHRRPQSNSSIIN